MTENIQNTFRALADPTRRDILIHLSKKEMTIGEVASQFDMTRAAIKKHLVILEEGKLVSVHPQGRERVNRLEASALKSVADWTLHFSEFWNNRLNKLQSVIEENEE